MQNIQFMKDHFPKEKTHNFEVISYPKAGHLIEPPYTPLCDMSYHKSFRKSVKEIRCIFDDI